MKYCDLHCDVLTQTGERQVTAERLKRGDCLLQCFAAFLDVRENRFETVNHLIDRFEKMCEREKYRIVKSKEDIEQDKINALLTVEEGGAIEGDLKKLDALFQRGVRMMTLVWNYPNEIGFPNFPRYEELFTGGATLAERETVRGLTAFGRETVARMMDIGMLVDVSHGSDKLFYDVAEIADEKNKPFVASHSGAQSVYDCARNLTDAEIKRLADLGGVVGIDFCADFISDDQSAEGQRAAILAHARAIVNAGGEDALCIGSDFDGIPENAYMKNPASVPLLLEEFTREFGFSTAEKIAWKNFLRIL